MANFLLIYTGGEMPSTETEQKAVVDEWMTWFGKLGDALVDGGNPIAPKARTIASDGKVLDGPEGTMATGYSILRADTLDEAITLGLGCPVLKAGARITVYETFNAM